MVMEEQQMEKKFTWVSPNLSYCLGNTCYSRPYSVAGCNWYLSACPKGDYLCLSLELEPESLPPGWSRDVKFDDNTSKEASDDLDDDGASSHVSNNGDDTSEETSEDGDASKGNLADDYDDYGPLSQSNISFNRRRSKASEFEADSLSKLYNLAVMISDAGFTFGF
ncbi:TRAF-like protein [Raphanus sativus]|nr:TRAF-like protein [Raphanus sativus]